MASQVPSAQCETTHLTPSLLCHYLLVPWSSLHNWEYSSRQMRALERHLYFFIDPLRPSHDSSSPSPKSPPVTAFEFPGYVTMVVSHPDLMHPRLLHHKKNKNTLNLGLTTTYPLSPSTSNFLRKLVLIDKEKDYSQFINTRVKHPLATLNKLNVMSPASPV
jgi:hypothetical protein